MGPTLAANEQHLHTDLAIVPADLQTHRNKAEAALFHQPGNSVPLGRRRARRGKNRWIIRGRYCVWGLVGSGGGRVRWDHVTDGVAPETASWLPRCPGSWRGWGPGWWLWGGTGHASGPYRWRRHLAALPSLPPPPVQEDKIANVVRIQESLQRKHIEHNEQKSGLRWKGSFRKGHWIGQNHLDKQFSMKLQINTSMSMATLVGILKRKNGGKSRGKQVRQDDSTQPHPLPLLDHLLLVPLPFGLQLSLCRQDLANVDPRLKGNKRKHVKPLLNKLKNESKAFPSQTSISKTSQWKPFMSQGMVNHLLG